jgi:uncharacterized damage-inducible protein DinB
MFIEFFTTGMTDEDWQRQPPGVPNAAVWTLGHLAFQRARFLELLTGRRTYDESWVALFDLGCESHNSNLYPSVDACRAFLDERLQDLRAYLEVVTEEDLAGPPCVPSKFFQTKAAALVHLTHHEAHHSGSLSLLRRLLGKEKVI